MLFISRGNQIQNCLEYCDLGCKWNSAAFVRGVASFSGESGYFFPIALRGFCTRRSSSQEPSGEEKCCGCWQQLCTRPLRACASTSLSLWKPCKLAAWLYYFTDEETAFLSLNNFSKRVDLDVKPAELCCSLKCHGAQGMLEERSWKAVLKDLPKAFKNSTCVHHLVPQLGSSSQHYPCRNLSAMLLTGLPNRT